VEVGRSTLGIIEHQTDLLKIIDQDINGQEDFEFHSVEDLGDKKIELLGLGKGGFVVAIGQL